MRICCGLVTRYEKGMTDTYQSSPLFNLFEHTCSVRCGSFSLLLRKEALLDEFFGNLNCVCCGSLAEVVGYAPEIEAVFY